MRTSAPARPPAAKASACVLTSMLALLPLARADVRLLGLLSDHDKNGLPASPFRTDNW